LNNRDPSQSAEIRESCRICVQVGLPSGSRDTSGYGERIEPHADVLRLRRVLSFRLRLLDQVRKLYFVAFFQRPADDEVRHTLAMWPIPFDCRQVVRSLLLSLALIEDEGVSRLQITADDFCALSVAGAQRDGRRDRFSVAERP